MVKLRPLLLAVAVAAAAAWPAPGQESAELPTPAGGNGRSERAAVTQWIGPVKVTIEYCGPTLHGRADEDRAGHVWGELVHYGFTDEGLGPAQAAPWRAGANETTRITFSHPVRVEGRDLAAGTYGLFLDVEPTGRWTWIVSRSAFGWGSFQYDAKDDVLRLPVVPRDAPRTDDLTYDFENRSEDGATAVLRWEMKSIPLRIEVPNVAAVYVDEMRRQLQGWPGFDYRNWQTAAQFCADHGINLDEALVWADKAIREPFRNASQGHEDFSTLGTKAAVLTALGRNAEADELMDRALTLPATSMLEMFVYTAQLVAAERKDRAVHVAELNRSRHPQEPFWTWLGLARAYTLAGDKPHAIAAWKAALQKVPPPQRPNIPHFERALAALTSGS